MIQLQRGFFYILFGDVYKTVVAKTVIKVPRYQSFDFPSVNTKYLLNTIDRQK